jgi:hypothetical protein
VPEEITHKPVKRHNEDDSNAYYIFAGRNSNAPVSVVLYLS